MSQATVPMLMLVLAVAAVAAASATTPTWTGAASATTACPTDSADCTIADLTAPISGSDLLARLSSSTRRLTVRNLNLTDWPAGETGRAKQLETLDLDRVSLGGPEPHQLMGRTLPGLRSLRMSGSGDGQSCPFNAGVASFVDLQEVGISGCRVGPELTPAWLRDLPRLTRLTVDNARVEYLRLAGLDRATGEALTVIRLSGNIFNTLFADSFGDMPNLTNLTLDGNIVQYIHAGAFSRLPALRELSITLPLPKEGQLTKIWETRLDGRFDNNTNLETLRLVNARLAENQIQRCFEPLKRLRDLDLRGHRFHQLQNSVLSSLTSLEQLDLSNGSLVCLYDRNFGVMARLRRLNLAHNAIRMIGRRAMLGLAALTSLNLTGNPVEAIEPGAFCTLRPELKEAPGLLEAWGLEPSRVDGAVNISDPCPADLNPNHIMVSVKPKCLLPKAAAAGGGAGANGKKSQDLHSRHTSTFLIIIGLCVAFLLITVISMMAYKGWSKRKTAQLAQDEEKELELQAMVAAAAAAEENGGASSSAAADGAGGGGGSKKPQNGRQHHQHHHHHRKSGGNKSPPSSSPSQATATGVQAASSSPSSASAAPPQATTAADANATAAATKVETTAQVESPERQKSPQQAVQAAAAAAGSTQPQQPQMRPGITPMTTVPEDSDLEARAITTLVVI